MRGRPGPGALIGLVVGVVLVGVVLWLPAALARDLIGRDAVYGGNDRVGAALARATEDARAWVDSRLVGGSDPS